MADKWGPRCNFCKVVKVVSGAYQVKVPGGTWPRLRHDVKHSEPVHHDAVPQSELAGCFYYVTRMTPQEPSTGTLPQCSEARLLYPSQYSKTGSLRKIVATAADGSGCPTDNKECLWSKYSVGEPIRATGQVFGQEACRILITSALRVGYELDRLKAAGPVLFIGDSPNWIFHTLKALNIEASKPWIPLQLPLSGRLYPKLYQVKEQMIAKMHVEGRATIPELYYDQGIKQIWPTELPAEIYVMDYTGAYTGQWSTVDLIERFLQVIAKEVIKQSTVPRFKLLHMVPGDLAGQPSQHLSSPFNVEIVARNPVENYGADGDLSLLYGLINGHYPRGEIKYEIERIGRGVRKLEKESEQ